jgi:hypothetical protein
MSRLYHKYSRLTFVPVLSMLLLCFVPASALADPAANCSLANKVKGPFNNLVGSFEGLQFVIPGLVLIFVIIGGITIFTDFGRTMIGHAARIILFSVFGIAIAGALLASLIQVPCS